MACRRKHTSSACAQQYETTIMLWVKRQRSGWNISSLILLRSINLAASGCRWLRCHCEIVGVSVDRVRLYFIIIIVNRLFSVGSFGGWMSASVSVSASASVCDMTTAVAQWMPIFLSSEYSEITNTRPLCLSSSSDGFVECAGCRRIADSTAQCAMYASTHHREVLTNGPTFIIASQQLMPRLFSAAFYCSFGLVMAEMVWCILVPTFGVFFFGSLFDNLMCNDAMMDSH